MNEIETTEETKNCQTCKGTGWVNCKHIGTPRDEEGWCEPCGEPAVGTVRRWCECEA